MSRAPVLYVMLHALHGGPKDFTELQALILERDADAVFFTPPMSITVFSTITAQSLAESLAKQIQTKWEEQAKTGASPRIIVIGHSAGAMLGRAAWLCARATGAAWADRVERFVLLAAVASGWRPNVAMSPWFRLLLWIYGLIDHLPGTFFGFDLRRGSAFLTTLRLRWLKAADELGARLPPTVQLIGSRDDIVSPADNIDLITGSTSFHYLEVENTSHDDVIWPRTDARREALTAAIFDPPEALVDNRRHIPKDLMADLFNDKLDDFDASEPSRAVSPEKVEHAVMVVHGIRDYGFWTKRLANQIKKEAKGKVACRTVTSSYGYFPMGPFLLPSQRRIRAEWLMDQYVQTRALYPHADVSFVGHSNGTYLLTEALDSCPEIKLKAVVFAGSVVDRRYPWETHIAAERVERVLNYVATSDAIVAAFPKFLGRIPGLRLGSAGTDGFLSSEVGNFRFAPGGHDAGIRSRHWPNIARFVLFGEEPVVMGRPDLKESTRREWFLRFLSVGALPFLIAVAVAIGVGLWWLTGGFDGASLLSVGAVLVWVWVLGKLLKHF